VALTDSLISYWKLDEASGDRADSHGANTLTDNNTVGSTTGKINSAADFASASSEYLSHVDNSDLSTGDIDFTIAAWVYLADLSTFRIIVSKDDEASGSREYFLEFNGSTFAFNLFKATDSQITATWSSTPSATTWYYVVGWHDAAANEMYIQVNNGTPDGIATGGSLQASGNAQFMIGAREYSGFPSYWNGRIDEVGFWKRVLTSGERTDLYNSGSGFAYPFGASSAPVVTPFQNRLMSPGHIFGGKCLC
jgi:hypothetical protein